MADRKPLKVLPDSASGTGGGDSTGIGEFVEADTLGVVDGGTGLGAVATSNILTGNGTSALSAESNLTFDGTDLSVTQAASGATPHATGSIAAFHHGGSDGGISIMSPNGNNSYLYFGDVASNIVGRINYNHGNNSMNFRVNDTEVATIDSSGDLSMTSSNSGFKYLTLKNTNTSTGVDRGSALVLGGAINADNYTQGNIEFHYLDTTVAMVVGASNGSTSGTGRGGMLRFWTKPDGGGVTERMRISSDGWVLIGKTAAASNQVGSMFHPSGGIGYFSTNGNPTLYLTRLSSTGTVVSFQNDTTEVGTITRAASSVAYNTSSDYRLKENVVDLTGAVNRVAQLQPHRFNFIADPDTTVDGFVAHEVSDIVPEAITGTKDGMQDLENVVVDADGGVVGRDKTEADWIAGKEPTLVSEAVEAVDAVLYVDGDVIPEGKSVGDVKTPAVDAADAVYADPAYAADTVWHETLTVPDYQGIDQAKLVPLLTAAIQELTARVAALESA